MVKNKSADPTGTSVASFVLGVASLALCVAPFMLVAAVVGLCLNSESKKRGTHSLQTAGMVLNIIAVVLSSISICIILGILFAGVIVG